MGLVVAAAILLVAVYLVLINRTHQVNAAWAEAARHLRLRFSPGSILAGKSIKGALKGQQVEIDTFTRRFGKNRRATYTRYRVLFPRPLGLGLRLTRKGVPSGMGRGSCGISIWPRGGL